MTKDLQIDYVPVTNLKPCEYNPRKWNEESRKGLTESLDEFGFVQPLVVNASPKRYGIVIGGNFKLDIAKKKGVETVPVVWVNIPDLDREKELNLRLNKNQGEFDFELLSAFDENFLKDVGFSSEELDNIFDSDEEVEQFDLIKELAKLNITNIEIKKGDVYEWPDGSRLMCGDSTVAEDMQVLSGDAKFDMCLTDPPYRLDYLKGKKKNGKPIEGFGAKRDRKYLETDVLPENFTDLWMSNIAAAAKDDFHIIVYENWKNLREIWGEMEKHWKVKNMLVWHLPNRTQGFSAKYKFFSKHDIAMVGSSPEARGLNASKEEKLLQNEYQTALYAIQGKPHWEGYKKGRKYQPTDFIEYIASDAKSSGQGVIFGTKPLEILIPYVKVLTKRGDLIVEPFGGSGSSGAAAITMKRRCYTMEKVPAYAEIIRRRWSKLLGQKPKKIYERKSA